MLYFITYISYLASLCCMSQIVVTFWKVKCVHFVGGYILNNTIQNAFKRSNATIFIPIKSPYRDCFKLKWLKKNRNNLFFTKD